MNQLFLITWRWLKRDKKRTALTLASIVLSVFLISFVGVYMSTALNALHASREYESPEHAAIFPETMEQARTLDNNVAWESHGMYISDSSFLASGFLQKYAYSDVSCFPMISINGVDVFDGVEDRDFDIEALAYDGDFEKLIGQQYLTLTGELPTKPHEVAVSRAFAAKYGGLDIGDTLTIRYEVRGGKLFAADLDDEGEPIRDENGEVIYNEDLDGQRLKEIYTTFADFGGYIVSHYRTFADLYRVRYGKEPLDRVRESVEDTPIPPAYAELSDEVIESYEYTATITGFADSASGVSICDIVFSMNDSDIMQMIGGDRTGNIEYLVRVKKGIDAEEVVRKAIKSLGYEGEDIDAHYYLNVVLLQLEGRQLEYIEDLQGLIIFVTVVMALFMFLARLIINNAFEISAAYRTEQYGALKTIGASDKQLFTMIMFECGMYMLIALPAGMGSAVLLGRAILKKIRDIKIFDPIYGEGISDKFFTLELSPFIMWLAFGCALFSVFFSAYADAMRVKRMPPIQSVGYRTSKRRIWLRPMWLSRRFFGYPFGFAVKCISKQKVRFAVTLLASVISGILIMTLTTVVKSYSDKEAEKAQYIDVKADIRIWSSYADEGYTSESVMELYEQMKATGLFDEIYFGAQLNVKNELADDSFLSLLSDDFKNLQIKYYGYSSGGPLMIIQGIPRDQFDKYIDTDVSYDELLASGKVLLCNSVCIDSYDDNDRRKLLKGQTVTKSYRDRDQYIDFIDIEPFCTDDISVLELKDEYVITNDDGVFERDEITNHVEVAGFYTTDNIHFAGYAPYIWGLMPIEGFSNEWLESTKAGYDHFLYQAHIGGFTFYSKEDKKHEASGYVASMFGKIDDGMVDDRTAQDAFETNGVKALKIAGFSFAGVLAAVVLLNIFSTMSANMINRRRDLSMMRSCGMSMRQVRKSFIIESSFYAVITTIVSSILGWALGIETASLISNGRLPQLEDIFTGFSDVLSSFPWAQSGILFIVIMFTMAAAYLPSLAAMSKSNIAQDIRTDM